MAVLCVWRKDQQKNTNRSGLCSWELMCCTRCKIETMTFCAVHGSIDKKKLKKIKNTCA